MDKFEKHIMVVPRKILFDNDHFDGFKHNKETDYESRILSNYIYMKRGVAENDPEHKQPVGYAIIVNPKTKKVFAYQRSKKDKEYTETRLQGKWSWGVGGHIDKIDSENGNPIHTSMLRELQEEVNIQGDVKTKVLGYINDDKDSVGQVHFGILYLIETDAEEVHPNAPEISSGKLIHIEEIEKINKDPELVVESWSQIAIEPLKDYFKSSGEQDGSFK